MPVEWRCTCGKWLPMDRAQHAHMVTPTLTDVLAARKAGQDESALAVNFTPVRWTPDRPTRKIPDAQTV